MLLEIPLSTSTLFTKKILHRERHNQSLMVGPKTFSCSHLMWILFHWFPGAGVLDFLTSLGFSGDCIGSCMHDVTYLKAPNITLITLSCRGGEAWLVLDSLLFSSLLKRRLFALPEKNSQRYPFLLASSLPFSEMQSSILWMWSLWNAHYCFWFWKIYGAFIF